MVQLIKKGGLRERANRSRFYQGSENTETTLQPNRYRDTQNTPKNPNDQTQSDAKEEILSSQPTKHLQP